MTGMRKRSNDPKGDQKKMTVNPLYNTSSILKMVGDVFGKATKTPEPKKKK